ncbi:MAG: response regulator [bacterium]
MDNKYTILIIDDEEIIQNSCMDILNSEDYDIMTASDGIDGLKIIEKVTPDLVFIDIQMPHISGLEVLERINNIDPTIVTVIVTGYPSVNVAIEAMKKGAYDFIAKPFTPEELRFIVKRGLERRRLLLENISLRREKALLRENIVIQDFKIPLSTIQQDLLVLLNGCSSELNQKQKQTLERVKSTVDELIKLTKIWLNGTSLDVPVFTAPSIMNNIKPRDFN